MLRAGGALTERAKSLTGAATIVASHLGPLVEALGTCGARDVLAPLGLRTEDAFRVDLRVPFATMCEAWERTAEAVRDPAFGLKLGSGVRRGQFGHAIELAIRASASLGEAWSRCQRWTPLITDGIEVGLTRRAGLAFLTQRATTDIATPRVVNDVFASSFHAMGVQMTGIEWRPREVWFAHARPRDVASYAPVFGGATLHFDRPVTALVVDPSILDLAVMAPDPALIEMLERLFMPSLDPVSRRGDILDTVRGALAAQLPGHVPTSREIARLAGVSARTLQRHLARRGTCFKELLDDTRRQIACSLLCREGMGVTEIAYLAGFSEPSAFHRAFRRWTGSTPSEWRVARVGNRGARDWLYVRQP